jgi:hypothetical protein
MHFGHWPITLLLGGAVFVPLLVYSLMRIRPAGMALAASAVFSIGAMLGFFLGVAAAAAVIPRVFDNDWYGIPMLVFATAGAVGGAALALAVLRNLAARRLKQR